MSDSGVLVWGGATGQARVVTGIIRAMGLQVESLLDINERAESVLDEGLFFAGSESIERYLKSEYLPQYFVVAVGSNGRARCQLADKLIGKGMEPLTLIHPSAWVAPSAVIGLGSQILGAAAISENVKMGRQTIINTNATVDHDTVIGEGVHVMPAATLTGSIYVDDYAIVGANATVLPRLRVGREAFVGAGAVVTKHVSDGDTVVGVPAKIKTGECF